MKNLFKKALGVTLIFILSAFFFIRLAEQAYATTGLIVNSSIQLSDPRPSQPSATYTAVFAFPFTTAIKCINIKFATNADMTGSVPTDLITTSAVKGTIAGNLTNSNWTLYNATNGMLQYENSSGEIPVADSVSISTAAITNPSIANFYAQVTTYGELSGHDCSSIVDQSNVMAMATTPGLTTDITVNPTISFNVNDYGAAVNGSGDTSPITTTSSTIPFGGIAVGSAAWGSQTLTVSTNAAHGYTLYIRDTQPLTNDNNDTIRDQPGTTTSPQNFDAHNYQSSFGYTADGNGVVFGNNKWAGLTQTNVIISTRNGAINSDATHVEFKIGASFIQPAGNYSTSIEYVAVPAY